MGVANQTPQDVATEYAALQFIIRQLMTSMATATLVRVQGCSTDGGLARAGTVDVQLLVDQQTENGETIPHGTVFKAPYLRMQGGTNAVVLDPVIGDLGVCVFASRDISAIKGAPDAALNRSPVPGATPGSRRIFSLSDALYLGGMLNAPPENYVQFLPNGEIKVVSAVKVTIEAPEITLDGHVTATAGMDVTGDVTGDGTSLHTHVHSGIAVGGANSGPPV